MGKKFGHRAQAMSGVSGGYVPGMSGVEKEKAAREGSTPEKHLTDLSEFFNVYRYFVCMCIFIPCVFCAH